MQLARFLRTLVHYQPAQLVWRGRYRARRALRTRRGEAVDADYAERAALLAEPRLDDPGLARVAALRAARRDPVESGAAARDALEGRFTFLGRTLELGADVAWFRSDLDRGTRLWKTLLHEFPYALDLALAERATGDAAYRKRFLELTESWCAAAPIHRAGASADAWNARAVANRFVNWSVAASLFGLRHEGLGRALAVHALFLRENLEWDVRANHLLRDAVGLVFADRLLDAAPDALSLLRAQVEEQVLPDGCHYERTPLYHAIALQDLVEVRALLGSRAPLWLEEAIRRMSGFLAALLPDDGRLPLFGDTWHGEVDARGLLAEAGPGVAPEPSDDDGSGLLALRRGRFHAVFRTGPHGPDHQLGHAHADGLSFELSHGPARIVTDTGTLTYDAGEGRDRSRSTAAHNTVQIDGAEQIECWGSFRVGRRGRGRLLARGDDAGIAWAVAEHDGWRFLRGRPRHARLLLVCERGALVLDAVTGRGRHRIRSALHLHPEADLSAVALGAKAARTTAPLHERFNESREMTELTVEAEAELPWIGGWAIGPAAEVELSRENGIVRCTHPGLGIEVHWTLSSSEVRLLPGSAAAGSAN